MYHPCCRPQPATAGCASPSLWRRMGSCSVRRVHQPVQGVLRPAGSTSSQDWIWQGKQRASRATFTAARHSQRHTPCHTHPSRFRPPAPPACSMPPRLSPNAGARAAPRAPGAGAEEMPSSPCAQTATPPRSCRLRAGLSTAQWRKWRWGRPTTQEVRGQGACVGAVNVLGLAWTGQGEQSQQAAGCA